MAKKKGFWNDSKGLTVKDFEKIVTGCLFIIAVITICIRYAVAGSASSEMIYLAGMLGTLFIARKGFSYLKPERYYDTEKQTGEDLRG